MPHLNQSLTEYKKYFSKWLMPCIKNPSGRKISGETPPSLIQSPLYESFSSILTRLFAGGKTHFRGVPRLYQVQKTKTKKRKKEKTAQGNETAVAALQIGAHMKRNTCLPTLYIHHGTTFERVG